MFSEWSVLAALFLQMICYVNTLIVNTVFQVNTMICYVNTLIVFPHVGI